MSDSGHIIGGPADPDYDGAVLTADLGLGDTVLHVDDVADFDEDGTERDARLIIGLEFDSSGELDSGTGTPLAYTTCDDDAGTVTLSAASTVTASAGDRVYIEDPVSSYPVGRLEVMVAVDGGDSTGDALSAFLDISLLESVGDADLTDLAVDLEEDEDGQLYVHGFRGLIRRQGEDKFDQDETTAVGPGGVVVLQLKYVPKPNSEHLYWEGEYQPGDQWTRDRWTVSIPDPDGLFLPGDKLVMEYAYTDPATSPAPSFSAPVSHARSSVWDSYPSSFITSVPLPTGTQIGDPLFVSAVGDNPASTLTTDPRITTIISDGVKHIGIGVATDLSDLACHIGGTAFTLDQFAGVEILSIQGDGSGSVVIDPARISVDYLPTGGAIGSVGGTGHGVVAVVAAAYGSPITLDWAGHMSAFTDWGGHIATAVLGNFGYRASEPPPATTNPANAPALVALIGLK